jgi:hypothetical protein
MRRGLPAALYYTPGAAALQTPIAFECASSLGASPLLFPWLYLNRTIYSLKGFEAGKNPDFPLLSFLLQAKDIPWISEP